MLGDIDIVFLAIGCIVFAIVGGLWVWYEIKKAQYPGIDDVKADYDDELDERIVKLLKKSKRRREEVKDIKKG